MYTPFWNSCVEKAFWMSDATTIAEELKAGRTVLSFTKGVSMQPLLWQGRTHVAIVPITRELRLGDIPIFASAERVYVLHRLVGMDEQFYYTRGDNCISCEKVPRDRMLGVVKAVYWGSHEIPVTNKGYRVYVWIWMHTAWLRIPVHKVWIKIRAAARKIKHHFAKK